MDTRRSFIGKLAGALTSYALIQGIFQSGALKAGSIREMDHWAIRLNEMSMDLRKGSIEPGEWQNLAEDLFNQVPLTDVLSFIDFNKLAKGFEFPDLGVSTRYVNFPRLSGLPETTVFVKKLFGMSRQRAIIPHGHSNMASAHLVLEGEMHLRQYDKIRREDKELIIQPTVDKVACAGITSSISDDQNNIHWFIARTSQAFTLDVIMLDLDGKSYDIHNLDMKKASALGNGQLRVPEIPVEQALRLYGKEQHH